MPKRKSYDQQFKEETIQYVRDHPEMSVKTLANERGVSFSTLIYGSVIITCLLMPIRRSNAAA